MIQKITKKNYSYQISLSRNKLLLYITLLLFVSVSFYFCQFSKRNLLFNFSKITLKTNGIGNIKILSNEFFENYKPCSVYINDSPQDINNEYFFNYSQSIIIIISWNVSIISTKNMFLDCHNIIEIDLSNFDSSQIIDMEGMFYLCNNLISLNITNFNTSQVKYMHYLFHGCSSLISLNLSNFDTSKVNRMEGMFSSCSKLTLLDLSNFKITRETLYNNFAFFFSMFIGCNDLEYINFKKLNLSSIGDFQHNILLEDTAQNFMICSENDNDILIKLLREKIILYCIRNNSFTKKYKCYKKNSTLYNVYTCNICGNNFLKKYHLFNENNYSYINCFESKDFYYLDEADWNY